MATFIIRIEQIGAAAKLLTFIRKVSGSNLCRGTDYPEVLRDPSHALQTHADTVH
jgi:hypothetical protein